MFLSLLSMGREKGCSRLFYPWGEMMFSLEEKAPGMFCPGPAFLLLLSLSLPVFTFSSFSLYLRLLLLLLLYPLAL